MLHEKRFGKVAVFDYSVVLVTQGCQVRQHVSPCPVYLSIGADEVTNSLDVMNYERVAVRSSCLMASWILTRISVALAHSLSYFLPSRAVVVRVIPALPQMVIGTTMVFRECFAGTCAGTITGFRIARTNLERFTANLADFLNLASMPTGVFRASVEISLSFGMACLRTIASGVFQRRYNRELFTACCTRLFDMPFVARIIASSIALRPIATLAGPRAKPRGLFSTWKDFELLATNFARLFNRSFVSRVISSSIITAIARPRTEGSVFGNAAPSIKRLSTCWALFLHCCGRVRFWISHLCKYTTDRISFQGQMSPRFSKCITLSMDVIPLERSF